MKYLIKSVGLSLMGMSLLIVHFWPRNPLNLPPEAELSHSLILPWFIEAKKERVMFFPINNTVALRLEEEDEISSLVVMDKVVVIPKLHLTA